MWHHVDLDDAADRIRAHPEISEFAAVQAPGGPLYVLVESQGFVYGPVLRNIVHDELEDRFADIAVAVVRAVPRRDDGAVDPDASVPLAQQISGDPVWVFPLEPATTDDERAVADLLTEALGVRRLSMTDSLPLLGADSLVLVEISAMITERFGVTVNGMDLFQVDNVRELTKLVFA
jgi:acyl carrier protein